MARSLSREAPRRRCEWVGTDPLMVEYHDREWGVPEYDGRALWEKLMLDGFQAGLSWRTILHKRPAFRRAFRGFAPERVARFGTTEIVRLVVDPGIVRSRAKIVSTVAGARAYLAMQRGGEDFSTFVWAFVGGTPLRHSRPSRGTTPLAEKISKELRARGFKFVGPVITYAWMQAVGLVNDHATLCFRRDEVGRAAGAARA